MFRTALQRASTSKLRPHNHSHLIAWRVSRYSTSDNRPTSASTSTSAPTSPEAQIPNPEPRASRPVIEARTDDRPTKSTAPSPNDLQLAAVQERLREWTHQTATLLRQRTDTFTHNLAVTFAQLGRELNRVTGYGEIEALKKKVVEQEIRISAAREKAKRAKEAYDAAVLQRASSQREVNDLLQRKGTWSDADVGRFTELVRRDHLYEQEEARAKIAATESEDAVELEFSELMRVILNRYHEEQVWADKIRSASTYGSLAVLGINVLVFVAAVLFVEPWKRRKLAVTFEKKVEQMTADTIAAFESRTEALTGRLDEQKEILTRVAESVYYAASPPEVPSILTEVIETEGLPAEAPRRRIPDDWIADKELVTAFAASATAAGIIGWIARSWFRP